MSSTFASFSRVSKWVCWPWLDEYYSLNIFEQTTSTNELAQKFVNKEFLIFKQHKWTSKTSIVLFSGGRNMNQYFPNVGFLACQTLGIVGS
jgi:hypothetical protein